MQRSQSEQEEDSIESLHVIIAHTNANRFLVLIPVPCAGSLHGAEIFDETVREMLGA